MEGGLWSLVSILFVPSRKIGKGAAGGHKASVGLKLRCLSAPVAAPEPCLVEGYVVGEENGKIVFWKAGSSL